MDQMVKEFGAAMADAAAESESVTPRSRSSVVERRAGATVRQAGQASYRQAGVPA
jgi:hypothetical protein